VELARIAESLVKVTEKEIYLRLKDETNTLISQSQQAQPQQQQITHIQKLQKLQQQDGSLFSFNPIFAPIMSDFGKAESKSESAPKSTVENQNPSTLKRTAPITSGNQSSVARFLTGTPSQIQRYLFQQHHQQKEYF